ncbi:MAG: hypothetical protein JWO32_1456 [Bacteroidetes bacterium]|nr:hypothetical protein [Bacteroidota bacterium]
MIGTNFNIFIGKLKLLLLLHGQVFHDQLLLNPPGWERSKGRWLSGAMKVACPFFLSPGLFSKS